MRLRAKIAALLAGLALVVLVVGLSRDQASAPTAGLTPAPVGTSSPAVPTVAASTPPASSPTPSPTQESGASIPADPSSLTADARRRWEPVVRGFGGAFSERKLAGREWRATLEPYAESPVRTALRTDDRKQIPDQRYQGYDVIDASDADVAVQVNYSDGWAIVLYLHTADQQHWLVHAYDRLEE